MEDVQKTINNTEKTPLKRDFLQSEEWRKFQESVGRKTFHLEGQELWANVVTHKLPIVGEYFYVPRGPILKIPNYKFQISNGKNSESEKAIFELISLAKKENVGWIRVESKSEEDFNIIKSLAKERIVKSPHDIQPKEIFVIDISKSEEELLKEMKSKTRYNIRLAEKKNVVISQWSSVVDNKKYVEEFLKLNHETAERDGIVTHLDEYYRKMVEVLPENMISLYLAEYEGKTIAANLVIFFEDTAIYAHGASSNEYREVMAPYLLQWKQIQDAKGKGFKFYDFGGIKSKNPGSWEGITRFKLGFSPKTEPIVFPGSYDIIINPRKYSIYRGLQKAKNILRRIGK